MQKSEKIIQVIFSAIDDVNQLLPKAERLEKSLDTALFGQSGSLDSLGFVNLIVAIEQRINEEFGASVTLADERAMSQKSSPFRTVGTLVDYISSVFDEKNKSGEKPDG